MFKEIMPKQALVEGRRGVIRGNKMEGGRQRCRLMTDTRTMTTLPGGEEWGGAV